MKKPIAKLKIAGKTIGYMKEVSIKEFCKPKSKSMISVIGITANTDQAGKDSAASFINEYYSQKYENEKFAKPLKQMIASMTGESMEYLETTTFKDALLPSQWDIDGTPQTGRDLMIMIGHGLRQLQPNIWVNAMDERFLNNPNPIIITDVRYRNEIEWIRSNNGVVVHIVRGKTKENRNLAEQQLDGYRGHDVILENNAGLWDLRDKVRVFCDSLVDTSL